MCALFDELGPYLNENRLRLAMSTAQSAHQQDVASVCRLILEGCPASALLVLAGDLIFSQLEPHDWMVVISAARIISINVGLSGALSARLELLYRQWDEEFCPIDDSDREPLMSSLCSVCSSEVVFGS